MNFFVNLFRFKYSTIGMEIECVFYYSIMKATFAAQSKTLKLFDLYCLVLSTFFAA